MRRLAAAAAAVVSVGLLVLTAAAFVRTERQKLDRGPIGRLDITRVFSPVCDCPTDTATIAITLRRGDRVTVEIVDADGEPVRTLVRRERYPRGVVELEWDGRDGDGRLVPDGTYRPRLELASGAGTFVLRNPIRVDTRAPRVTLVAVAPRTISPDGDRRRDSAVVRYEVDEPARGLLLVDGRLDTRTRFRPLSGAMRWSGKVDGRALPVGTYRLQVAAEDVAGNVGRRSRPVPVRIRYVELGRHLIRVRSRARFGVRVETDARSYRWRFAGATGVSRDALLILRAPQRPGRYQVFVDANGHGDRARVVVRPRPAAPGSPPGAP